MADGVNVPLIDETVYSSTGPTGTVPLIILATAGNKTHPSGIGVAEGTLTSNRALRYSFSSQQELASVFGEPKFVKNGSTVDQGNELNEWGLFAAYNFLGGADLVHVTAAPVDMEQLKPTTIEPTSNPSNGEYWFDTSATQWGLSTSTGGSVPASAWTAQNVRVFGTGQLESVILGTLGFADTSVAVNSTGQFTVTDASGNSEVITVTNTTTPDDIVDAINASVTLTGVTSDIITLAELSFLRIKDSNNGLITLSDNASGTVLAAFGFSQSQITYSQPLSNLGLLNEFAVVTSSNDNVIYQKLRPQTLLGTADATATVAWFPVGSLAWRSATPTVAASTSIPSDITNGDELIISDGINSVTVTFTNAAGDLAQVVTDINDAVLSGGTSAPPVFAQTSIGNLVITNRAGGDIVLTNGDQGTAVTTLNLPAITSGNNLVYASHVNIPDGSTPGDVWIRTTTVNNGTNIVVRQYNSATNQFTTRAVPLYTGDIEANNTLGVNAAAGSLYAQYNIYGDSNSDQASLVIKRYTGFGPVTITSDAAGSLNLGENFAINGITIDDTAGTSINDVVMAINDTDGLPAGISANEVNGQLVITNSQGTPLTLSEGNGTLLFDLKITPGVYSNWTPLVYQDSATSIRGPVQDDQLWYNTNFVVDIMVGDGDEWKGYRNTYPNTDPNGVILAGSAPATQSDGTPLVEADLWVDTSDLENYPRLYRWVSSTGAWNLVDNTDQTTPFGIIFSDARWRDGENAQDSQLPSALTLSDFVDPDAPDPRLYPSGTLLFNTRLSTLNVKRWDSNKLSDFVNKEYSVGAFTQASGIPTGEQGRWVSHSGLRPDGSPWMGRKAQRRVIINAMAGVINSSEELRSDDIEPTLLAAPGYPELIDELLNLNADRQETALVVADAPLRLAANPTDLNAWASNANNAFENGEDGLITFNYNLAVYYGWGLTSDINGDNVMVPPSHMALRTIMQSDNISFPWLAPAGYTRGLVTNATNVGYLNSEDEFVPIRSSQNITDTLRVNQVNSIGFIRNRGLALLSQKTRNPQSTSALSDIHVARLVHYLRTNFFRLGQPFRFEPNSSSVRERARLTFERFLGSLLSQSALEDFLVVCDTSNNTSSRRSNRELWIDVAIVPFNSIEELFIPIRLVNTPDDLG